MTPPSGWTLFILVGLISAAHKTNSALHAAPNYYYKDVSSGVSGSAWLIPDAVAIRLKRDVIAADDDDGGGGGGDQLAEEDVGAYEEHLLEKIDIPDAMLNETWRKQLKKSRGAPKNVTLFWDEEKPLAHKEENHKYYKTKVYNDRHYWVDLDKWDKSLVKENEMLSTSYRRAATIALKFQFPFYGHNVQNITIATGGFLYTGEYVHSWLAATQYIAPLMANFDTSKDERAKIRYADNGTALIVEWKDVYLQSAKDLRENMQGPFTFQAILHKSGDIMFLYKSIPLTISTIADKEHPVKVGLSDAYIIDRTIFFVRRKTIYEYHRVNMKNKEISNYTVIHFQVLPTCNTRPNCEACVQDIEDSECTWCSRTSSCSDGMDRNRQLWLSNNCDKYSIRSVAICQTLPPGGSEHRQQQPQSGGGYPPNAAGGGGGFNAPESTSRQLHETARITRYHSGMITLAFVCIIGLCLIGWLGYAYFYPHSWSGQVLIKYRPSSWHWRRGEARYSAASSIHM